MMLFSWIDFQNNSSIWWLLGHVFLGAFSIWLILRQRPVSDWIFLTVITLISGLMRLPVFLCNLPLNRDESQMLAQGLTFVKDPVVYRSVDPTTGGPLTSYLFTFLAHLGLPLNFHLAHVLCWLLTLCGLFFAYKAAKLLHLGATVQLAFLPFISFTSFIQTTDFVHFYSEILSMLLLNIGLCFLAYWSNHKDYKKTELILFGILIGLIPLCKIQAVPMAFVVALFALIQIFLFQRKKFINYSAFFVGSLLLVWGSWSIFLWTNEVFDDFITFYLKANFQYKTNLTSTHYRSPLLNFFRLPWVIIKGGSGFEWLFLPFCLIAFLFAGTVIYKKRIVSFLKMDAYFWMMILAYLIMADIAITRTGSFYPHYYHFLFFPFVLLMSLFLKYIAAVAQWVVLSTQLAFLYTLLQHSMYNEPIPNNYYSHYIEAETKTNISPTLLKYGHKGDYLAVWGWSCELYVEAQMPQGVNENHTTRSAMKHPMQSIYLERYVRDLKRTRPPIFVDAVGERALWIKDRKKYAHECFPELAHYISENYTFKEELEDVRIYVRK